MKIGICDDVKSFCEQLQGFVEEFAQQENLEIQIAHYSSAEEVLNEEKPCDILFLDMELGDGNGIDVLQSIQNKKWNTVILVVTAYSNYIDSAMDYPILRFIDKPVQKPRIFAALKKAVSLLDNNYIIIYDLNAKAKCRVAMKDIICAETKLRKIYLYTTEETYVLREGFKSFKQRLNASFFAEAHYSFVVNMNYIKSFKRTQLELDVCGKVKTVPVSGDKQSALRKKYAAFLGEDYAV